jgi:hypothetical protein
VPVAPTSYNVSNVFFTSRLITINRPAEDKLESLIYTLRTLLLSILLQDAEENIGTEKR